MTPLRRWLLVVVVALVVGTAPLLPRLLPAAATDVSAAELLSRVQASGDEPYSGYVETDGAVQLAVGADFSDLAELFGDQLRLRVWWDDETTWRVNRLLLSGEIDLVRDGATITEYDYERARAVSSRDREIRLPRTSDLVPPSLARITTEGAEADEVSRLPAQRIAGVSAAGLRLEPTSEATTIDHVDLWVEEESGLALAVEVYAVGSDDAVLATRFEEFSSVRPAPGRTAPTWSDQVEQEVGDTIDLADAANQYAPFRIPKILAGLERSSSGNGAVGVFGAGVTRFIAVPLREQDADPLRESLLGSPLAVSTDAGTLLAVGPLSIYLTDSRGGVTYVLAGTVTGATLEQAARDVADGLRVRRGLR